jgi:hypothetical protein
MSLPHLRSLQLAIRKFLPASCNPIVKRKIQAIDSSLSAKLPKGNIGGNFISLDAPSSLNLKFYLLLTLKSQLSSNGVALESTVDTDQSKYFAFFIGRRSLPYLFGI